MVYGWMPTVLSLYPIAPLIDFSSGANLLNKAKSTGSLLNSEIEKLASVVNNSLVGTSKLLHFVSPQKFPIWDSKIYAFLFNEAPSSYRVNRIAKYRRYLEHLDQLQQDTRFTSFHTSVNGKVGYQVSKLRALELIMFLNAPVYRNKSVTLPIN